MDIADEKDQDTQEQGDFDDIINKELQAAYPTISSIKPKGSKKPSDESIKPLHTQDLILNEVPNGSCHELRFLMVDVWFWNWGLTFATIALSGITGNSGKLLDERNRRRSPLGADAVVGPFTFLPAGDNPGLEQDLHVVRKPGLPAIEIFKQLARALFATAQHLEHTQAGFVTKSLEHTCLALIIAFHTYLTLNIFDV